MQDVRHVGSPISVRHERQQLLPAKMRTLCVVIWRLPSKRRS